MIAWCAQTWDKALGMIAQVIRQRMKGLSAVFQILPMVEASATEIKKSHLLFVTQTESSPGEVVDPRKSTKFHHFLEVAN